jgi:hypothetical protein
MRARGARRPSRRGSRSFPRESAWQRPVRPLPSHLAGTIAVQPTHLRPSTAVKASASNDGLILLDVDGGLVLSSNAVGACIWRSIEQQRSTEDIAQQLAEQYAIALDRARQDVQTFVSDLLDRGLVVTEPHR